jgi:hypothetical protein
MVYQLAEPKGFKRKASRWNPFRRILKRSKGKDPSESEMEHHDHSTVNNSCGSNSGSHVSPSTMDDFLYFVTGAPKSGNREGDAKSEWSGLLVELSNNDGSSACGSQRHASFTQLNVSSMEKETFERSDDPSFDQGMRLVYQTSSARDKAGLLVMGDTAEEMEELGTEVVYFTSGSVADSRAVDDGSEIFANDVSTIFRDDADDPGNGIFLSFEALGLLQSTDSEAERRNPLDSKAWDIHKSTDENEAEFGDVHAFKSSKMCQPISSEIERRRLHLEATLVLDCEDELKALGLREASEIPDKKCDQGLDSDGRLNALGLVESSATGHGKLDEKAGLGCEGEFESLGLRAVGQARYRNRHEYGADASPAPRSVVPPIPTTIETPRRLTLDYQLSDDSSDSINHLEPTSSGSVTWLSHDEVDFLDFDERPVKEIAIPSPSQRESEAKASSPSQAFRTALARTRDRLVENIKESMLMEPAVAPPIKRVVINGVGDLGRSSNVFTNPFEIESESGSKLSLFPRTTPSPPSEHLYHSPSPKLHSPPRALDSRGKNALNSEESDFQSGLTEFVRGRSELSIPTPNTWPPSKLATKYGMKSRLDRYASPDRNHDMPPPKSKRSPLGTKDSVSTSAESSNKASRTSKTYATYSYGSEPSPLRSMHSPFRTGGFSKSRSAETFNGSPRSPREYTSFGTSYSGASFDDPGCMFDNDAASAHSGDAEHEIVFSDGKFMQDVSTELLHSFEELAREGSLPTRIGRRLRGRCFISQNRVLGCIYRLFFYSSLEFQREKVLGV